MHYEYQILKADTPTVSEEQLNELSREGWELITILEWENVFYYYFKRLTD